MWYFSIKRSFFREELIRKVLSFILDDISWTIYMLIFLNIYLCTYIYNIYWLRFFLTIVLLQKEKKNVFNRISICFISHFFTLKDFSLASFNIFCGNEFFHSCGSEVDVGCSIVCQPNWDDRVLAPPDLDPPLVTCLKNRRWYNINIYN